MAKYTCVEYRAEMRLLALKNRLAQSELPEDERQRIIKEIKHLEAEMGMT